MNINKQILEMYENEYTYGEISNQLNITRNAVAGIIWRWKNPGMYKIGVTNKQHYHVPPYGLRKAKI